LKFNILNNKSIWIFISALTLGIWARINLIPFTGDDAYITFRYARNIASGLGFVYNPGEYVLGTTTPLLTLILASTKLISIPIIPVAKFIGITFGLAYLILIISQFKNFNKKAALTLLFAVTLSLIPTNVKWDVSGMETALYIFLVYVILFHSEDKPAIVIGLVTALCFLVRIDGILALGAIIIYKIINQHPPKNIIKILVYFSIFILPWLIFATIYFGSPVSNSATAKSITYAHYPVWTFSLMMFKQLTSRLHLIISLPFILAAISSIFYVLVRKKKYQVVSIWTILYIAFFSLTGAPMHGWYFAPLLPAIFFQLFVSFADLLDWVSRTITPQKSKLLNPALIILTVIALFASIFLINSRAVELREDWQAFDEEIVDPIADYLFKYGKEGDVLSLETFGSVGWFTDFPILDRGGLVSPEVIPFNRKVNGVNSIDIILHFKPRFVVTWATWEEEKMFLNKDKTAKFYNNYKLIESYKIKIKDWNFYQRIDTKQSDN
jgi:arabinofuranosyltransferase